jgi:hypothetical protein
MPNIYKPNKAYGPKIAGAKKSLRKHSHKKKNTGASKRELGRETSIVHGMHIYQAASSQCKQWRLRSCTELGRKCDMNF